jgi:Na+-translocating ferredoxin:NAD+ oxidoreductase RNF subunit RnfB
MLNLLVQQIGQTIWRAQCGKCGRKHTKMYAEPIGKK